MDPSRLTRRQVFRGIGGGLLGGGILGSVYNTTLGFGTAGSGTNLPQQAQDGTLERLAGRGLTTDYGSLSVNNDIQLTITGDTVTAQYQDGTETSFHLHSDDLPPDVELGAVIANLAVDIPDLRSGNFRFEFLPVDTFFERVESDQIRQYTTGFLRSGTGSPSERLYPDTFHDIIRSNGRIQLLELMDAFRERISYDIPRFTVGAVEDNIVGGRLGLRDQFFPESGSTTIHGELRTRLLCDEIAWITQQILHANPANRQEPPLAVSLVHDVRHKHIFNAISTVQRTEQGLLFLTTFVDYTYSTLINDLRLGWLLGDGLDAFNTRHRADYLRW